MKSGPGPGAGLRSLRLSPAVKVAAAATGLLAVVYVAAVILLNLLVGAHLSGKSEARLTGQLAAARADPSQVTQSASGPGRRPAREPYDMDGDSAPVYLWAASAGGTVTAHSPDAPSLPASLFRDGTARDGLALTAAPRPPGRAVPAEAGPGGQRAGWSPARAWPATRTPGPAARRRGHRRPDRRGRHVPAARWWWACAHWPR